MSWPVTVPSAWHDLRVLGLLRRPEDGDAGAVAVMDGVHAEVSLDEVERDRVHGCLRHHRRLGEEGPRAQNVAERGVLRW